MELKYNIQVTVYLCGIWFLIPIVGKIIIL